MPGALEKRLAFQIIPPTKPCLRVLATGSMRAALERHSRQRRKGLQVFQAHPAVHSSPPRPGQEFGGFQGRLPAAGLAPRDEIPVSPGVIAQAKRHYWKSSSPGTRPYPILAPT